MNDGWHVYIYVYMSNGNRVERCNVLKLSKQSDTIVWKEQNQDKESHGHLVEMAPSWCRRTNCHGVGHKDRVTFGIRLVPECEGRGRFNQQRDELRSSK